MDHKKLRQERIDADLSLAVVAITLGRTKQWLWKVECGQIDLDAGVGRKIREAIARLRSLQVGARESFKLSGLTLPAARNRRAPDIIGRSILRISK